MRTYILPMLSSVFFLACTLSTTQEATPSGDSKGNNGGGSGCAAIAETEPTACTDPSDCEPLRCECQDGTVETLQSCAISNGEGECMGYASCVQLCRREGSEICGGDGLTPKGDDDNGDGTPSGNSPTKPGSSPTNNGPPSQLTINGAMDNAKPYSTLSSDKKTLVTIQSAEAQDVTTSPSIAFSMNTPRLDKAQSMKVVRPSLGSCTSKPQLSAGSGGNVLLNFSGSDQLPSAACSDFAKKVASDGLEVEFSGVPYLNSSTVASKVILKLAP